MTPYLASFNREEQSFGFLHKKIITTTKIQIKTTTKGAEAQQPRREDERGKKPKRRRRRKEGTGKKRIEKRGNFTGKDSGRGSTGQMEESNDLEGPNGQSGARKRKRKRKKKRRRRRIRSRDDGRLHR